MRPAIAFRKVDLPAPLAPMMAMVSPSSSAGVDAVKRLEVAVEGRELAGLQAAACVTPRCRYRSGAPRASASPPAASPSAILRPKLSTTRRSTTASSACTICSIHTIVTPLRADLADGGDEFAALALGQAAGDLVEQQQPRLRWRARGPFRAACAPAGQRAGERVGALRADPSRSRISPQDCAASRFASCGGHRPRRPAGSRTR